MGVTTNEAARLRTALARADRLLAKQSGADGLTRTQASVLGVLARRGPTKLGDLAAHEGLHPTMLSRVVGALEAEGLLERRPADEDARQVVAQITPDGAARQERIQKQRTALIERYVDGLSPTAARKLWAALPVLEGLVESLQEQP